MMNVLVGVVTLRNCTELPSTLLKSKLGQRNSFVIQDVNQSEGEKARTRNVVPEITSRAIF